MFLWSRHTEQIDPVLRQILEGLFVWALVVLIDLVRNANLDQLAMDLAAIGRVGRGCLGEFEAEVVEEEQEEQEEQEQEQQDEEEDAYEGDGEDSGYASGGGNDASNDDDDKDSSGDDASDSDDDGKSTDSQQPIPANKDACVDEFACHGSYQRCSLQFCGCDRQYRWPDRLPPLDLGSAMSARFEERSGSGTHGDQVVDDEPYDSGYGSGIDDDHEIDHEEHDSGYGSGYEGDSESPSTSPAALVSPSSSAWPTAYYAPLPPLPTQAALATQLQPLLSPTSYSVSATTSTTSSSSGTDRSQLRSFSLSIFQRTPPCLVPADATPAVPVEADSPPQSPPPTIIITPATPPTGSTSASIAGNGTVSERQTAVERWLDYLPPMYVASEEHRGAVARLLDEDQHSPWHVPPTPVTTLSPSTATSTSSTTHHPATAHTNLSAETYHMPGAWPSSPTVSNSGFADFELCADAWPRSPILALS